MSRIRSEALAQRVRKSLVGLWLSRHATQPRWQLPIVGGVRSRVIRKSGARLDIHGRLHMGDAPTYVGYIARGMAPVIELQKNATLLIEGAVRVGDGARILLGPDATVTIGNDTHFDGDSRLICAKNISIGAGCAIAWGVLIMDTDFHRVDGRATCDAATTIGDHVWIGADAMVLKGVAIGDGAIVAAGAIVTRDVPTGALVAGNPARVVRGAVTWD